MYNGVQRTTGFYRYPLKIDWFAKATEGSDWPTRFWSGPVVGYPGANQAGEPQRHSRRQRVRACVRASRGIPLHLSLGTSQPEIAARARPLCACPTRPQSSPIAVPRRYCNSARLRSDAFFVRNVARHGAGSHRLMRSITFSNTVQQYMHRYSR